MESKTLKKWTSLICIVMCSMNVVAQKSFLNSVKETKELSESVSLLLLNNSVYDALDKLFPFWHDEQELFELKKQGIQFNFSTYQREFGKPLSYDRIGSASILDSYRKDSYVLKYKSTDLQLVFTYYKTFEGWMLYAFSYQL